MTPLAALLQGVIDKPDDDGARLLYADCCEENGDEARSEFVRVQVELARLEADPVTLAQCERTDKHASWECDKPAADRLESLRRRERELLASREWEQYLPEIDGLAKFRGAWPDDIGWLSKERGNGSKAIRVVWRRGFVEELRCEADLWLTHGDRIVAACPVRKVTPTTFTDADRGTLDRRWESVIVAGLSMGVTYMDLLEYFWDGITFELPPAPMSLLAVGGTFTMDAVSRAMLERRPDVPIYHDTVD